MLKFKKWLSSPLIAWSLIGAIAILFLSWLSFGAGQLAGAKWRAQQESVVGQKAWATLLPNILANGAKGQLVIVEDKTVYVDASGARWQVGDFKERVSQADLTALQTAKVPIDGKITITIEPTQAAGAQVALASYMKTTGNTAVGLLEVALAAALILFLVKMMSRGDLFGNRFNRAQKEERKTRFADVAGLSGPKDEVVEIIDYLRSPQRFMRTGARPATGILLYGPPGNGKTLLAKAIAGEADAVFLEQNASSFVQLYVGAGAMAVRGLFREARKKRPCVIFIDEIDSVGGRREGGTGGGHDERLQTLNALLAELDGFKGNEGLVVIAATNRVDDLDEALTRPGRFDRKVMVGLPRRHDRLEILRVHARKIPTLTADMDRWANLTQGFSGADLANLINEAAIEAARRDSDVVSDLDFVLARDRVLMGPKQQSHRNNTSENRVIAYHEAGHAVIRALKGAALGSRVSKVSILPRGKSLGVTISEGAEEALLHTREHIHAELLVLMGGRAAEQVFCGRVSTGAANDMQRASLIARDAMKNYGFGDFGPYIPEHNHLIAEIERAAATWLNSVFEEAVSLLSAHQAAMHSIAEQLLAEEEIDGIVVEEALGLTQEPAPLVASCYPL